MGKIRIKTIGDEEVEKKEKKKSKQKKQDKQLVKGTKGGERVVAVGPSEAELKAIEPSQETSPNDTRDTLQTRGTPVRGTRSTRGTSKKARSKSYQSSAKVVDKSKKYALNDALDLLEKLKRAKFDETVELHINAVEKGISGNITLPHGTGKSIRVEIASDDLLANVEKNKIDFDILLADPSMMPKLAKVARILGPKGLMPNPKNGTLVKDPAKSAENFKKGQISFKTESKTPIIHISVGKVSFGAKKLSENIHSLLENIQKDKIKNITLKSTMSPGIKLQI
jgi:large subunit ribosomal protein L1